MQLPIVSRIYSGIICIMLGCIVFAQPVAAQAPAGGAAAAEDVIRLRRVDAFGTPTKIKTPDFQVRNISRSAKPPADWYVMTVEYDTQPEWIDELTFNYFIVTEAQRDGAPVYYLFQHTVRYGDIERGRSHLSTVFLRPSTLKRYGEPVVAALEVMHLGQVVASGSQGQGLRLPDKWWTNAQVTGRMTSMAGYLLDRSQTPFALVNIDDYEVIK